MQKVIETLRALMLLVRVEHSDGSMEWLENLNDVATAIDLLTKLHEAWEARESATEDTIYTDSHIIDRADDALWSAVEAVERRERNP